MSAKIKLREIRNDDIPHVVELLVRGYDHARPREFWQLVFTGLRRRTVPAGFPRYGHVIESEGTLVGVIILIFSMIRSNGKVSIRCNGSGLYVDPAFRVYAPLLASRALRDINVTVLNITAAPHTRRMVEASGFTKYSNGIFVAIPVLEPAAQRRIGAYHRCPVRA